METVENLEINYDESKKRTRNVVPTEFPLPHIGGDFEPHHIRIFHAYSQLSPKGLKELKYSDFTRNLLDFNPQYVSGNNRFLESIGLIELGSRQGYYKSTQDLIEISNNIRYNKIEQAKAIIRNHLNDSWFYESAKNLLLMNGKVTINKLIEELAWKSKADLNKHQKGIKTLISYLSYAELINVDNESDEVYLNESLVQEKISISPEDKKEEISDNIEKEVIQPETDSITTKKVFLSSSKGTNVNISINVTITPEMSEDDIKNKIEAIFKALKNNEE